MTIIICASPLLYMLLTEDIERDASCSVDPYYIISTNDVNMTCVYSSILFLKIVYCEVIAVDLSFIAHVLLSSRHSTRRTLPSDLHRGIVRDVGVECSLTDQSDMVASQ